MAQSFVTDAGTLIIPSAVAQIKVAQSNSGLATNGVLFLVGEADAGADFTQETDLGKNAFGPDQEAEVLAKYKSGHLVDAFRGAAAAANDAGIPGSFSRAILVKTNPSAKASGALSKFDSSSYGTLEDRSYGKLGNLISYEVTEKTAEVVPTTGAFAFMLPIASTNINVRVNGGSASAITISALSTPATFAGQLNAVSGVDVDGGAAIGLVASAAGSDTLALAIVSGNRVQITRSIAFDALPSAGDTLYIPSGSVIQGGTNKNRGSYIVTGASATQILATKLLDASGSPNALTAPEAVSAVDIAATTDVQAFEAITAHLVESVDPIDGTGKTLEIAELTSASGLLSYAAYTLSGNTGAVATFFSKSGTPKILTSAAEYQATLTASRQFDNITEDLSAGGPVAFTLGYEGTTASAVNDGTTLTITVAGGSGSSPAAIPLKDYKSIADLAAYLSTLTGFTAAAGTAVLGSQSPLTLDQGTFTCCSTFGGTPGRIKQDAYKFYQKVTNDAVLVQLEEQAEAGQPAPTTGVSFLSGGTKGATTDAIYTAAMDKLALCRGNFVVPLFSRDATGDIADDLTEATSTYTIAGVHAATRSHVLKMSTLKARRNRQAFLSIRDTFDTAKNTAANLASYRCSCSFQDVKDLGSDGVEQFQPWMNAVKAAGMQAAAFYRPIFNKGINISGAVQAAGDFNDQDTTPMEDALTAGLLPITQDETGGFHYVSDQTTYGKDANFVYNSIQAVYVGDQVALTTAQRMERAFVGQSIADISASLALSTLESILDDMRRLKLISPSDDAPKGYKNPKIQIAGPVMKVAVEVKLAGAIYFIPISFLVSQVQQSA